MDHNNNNNTDTDTTGAKGTLDPRKLSFSQAQGYEELPGALCLGRAPPALAICGANTLLEQNLE